MSQQSLSTGQTQGRAEAKTEEYIQSSKDAANTTQDKASSAANSAQEKASNMSQSAKESGQHGQQQAAGILQQTSEQVVNMAHGAVDGMKNTLGVLGDHNQKK